MKCLNMEEKRLRNTALNISQSHLLKQQRRVSDFWFNRSMELFLDVQSVTLRLRNKIFRIGCTSIKRLISIQNIEKSVNTNWTGTRNID